jgi:hypothetical protein
MRKTIPAAVACMTLAFQHHTRTGADTKPNGPEADHARTIKSDRLMGQSMQMLRRQGV